MSILVVCVSTTIVIATKTKQNSLNAFGMYIWRSETPLSYIQI